MQPIPGAIEYDIDACYFLVGKIIYRRWRDLGLSHRRVAALEWFIEGDFCAWCETARIDPDIIEQMMVTRTRGYGKQRVKRPGVRPKKCPPIEAAG